jgi:hypothetical protein
MVHVESEHGRDLGRNRVVLARTRERGELPETVTLPIVEKVTLSSDNR